MEITEATLVERLNGRAHDPERATDEGLGLRDDKGRPVMIVAAPPATLAQVADAEARLGFPLPALLRQVYLEVGSGGFGPGYGLLGLSASPNDAGKSIVGKYAALRQAQSKTPWPEKLLPLCEWGCGIASYLDCSRPEAPVIRLDTNMEKADVTGRVPVPMRFDRAAQVADACWVESPSLGEWLEAWADGKSLFYLGYGGTVEGADEDDDEDDDEDEDGGEEAD